jgi:hypothetical protein
MRLAHCSTLMFQQKQDDMATTKGKKAKKAKAPKAAAAKPSAGTKTATATKTATKTSTDAYTQGNITVTGGAGKGATSVTIALPGGAMANNSKKPVKAKEKK